MKIALTSFDTSSLKLSRGASEDSNGASEDGGKSCQDGGGGSQDGGGGSDDGGGGRKDGGGGRGGGRLGRGGGGLGRGGGGRGALLAAALATPPSRLLTVCCGAVPAALSDALTSTIMKNGGSFGLPGVASGCIQRPATWMLMPVASPAD